jgi:uncharacterized ion transporter superfamily protein YfcC
MEPIEAIRITFVLWLVQFLFCVIIHILKETKWFPKTIKDLFLKFGNIIWVIGNFKKLNNRNE